MVAAWSCRRFRTNSKCRASSLEPAEPTSRLSSTRRRTCYEHIELIKTHVGVTNVRDSRLVALGVVANKTQDTRLVYWIYNHTLQKHAEVQGFLTTIDRDIATMRPRDGRI